MRFFNIFKGAADYFKDASLKRITSPFVGNVMPSQLLRDINLSKNVMGYSIGVIPESGDVLAPCKGHITLVSELGNSFCMRLGKINIIINLGLNRDLYKKEWFKLNYKVGDKVKRGVPILTMDLNQIMRTDPDFVCVITVKHSKELKYISMQNLRYVDHGSMLCSINVY